MVEGGDLVAELLAMSIIMRHLVGAVAVVLHQDLAVEHAGQRLELEVARRAVVVVLLVVAALLCSRGSRPTRGGSRCASIKAAR